MVHPRPQTPQGEPAANHETLLLIILRLTCKYDMKEAHCKLSKSLLKNVRGQKHPRQVNKCRNSIPDINHIRQIINVNIRYRTISVQKRQATVGQKSKYNYMNPISYIYGNNLYIYITAQVSELIQRSSGGNTLHIRRPGFSEMDKMCRHLGRKYSPSSVFWL